MIVARHFGEIPHLREPIGISMGTFDGVHLGHQALFNRLRQQVGSTGSIAALTFSNHPSELFKPHTPTPFLCTVEHKLKLFEAMGIDLVILIAFNSAFSKKPFDSFLQELKDALPFTFLTLGEGASFGKERRGNPDAVKALAPNLDIKVEYLPKTLKEGQPISSGRIRQAIQKGDLSEASALLGRPYSILSSYSKKGASYETSLPHLCLPPDGRYRVEVLSPSSSFGEAEISNATKTIRLNLTELKGSIAEKSVEILFCSC